ncbi:MAG: 50S ribosome-binding GTPase [Phycisphaerales bacterium]|nr:MAG: 50S ribosome-binding GTPase [Phycisphaerales bacterium]
MAPHSSSTTTRDSRNTMAECRLIQATANHPGAIAILQLVGDTVPLLAALTDIGDWPVGHPRLARFDDIDDGLVVRIADDIAQLMPHGGPRVLQRLIACLTDLGVRIEDGEDGPSPLEVYPEAQDEIEALALAAIARAQSPLAIDLLLDQPRRWRSAPTLTEADEERSRRLNRLIDPPIVVLAGPANVGKSTLSNALLGRSMSIALDEPGTTRDYTAGRIELTGLVVDWHDTPGLRDTSDPIEARAVELARRLMDFADLLLAITDADHYWPDLPRCPDLKIGSKCDLAGRPDADINVSAVTGEGVASLVTAVRDRLVPPEDLNHPGPWRFDPRLP